MSLAHSKVELKISCENLPYPSSIQVKMFPKNLETQSWESTPFETEIIENSINPEFVTGIFVDYHFEKLQQLRFTCMSSRGVIGHYDCLFSTILFKGGKIREKLHSEDPNDKSNAFIIILTEEVYDSKNVTLQIRAHSTTMIEKASLLLSRVNEDGLNFPVYRTQNISSTNPLWEFKLKESALCNGNPDRSLRIQLFKKDKRGDYLDTLLGECIVTLRELLRGKNFFPLSFPHKSNGNIHNNLSITIIAKMSPTFLDFVTGGTPIKLVIGIDFTMSNGDPKRSHSLHYTGNKNKENDYQQAIRSIGTILEEYDSDKKIPVYGFGAIFHGNMSHAYPLNNNFEDPEVNGVDDVMKIYQETMNSVKLHGPTNFSPIINQTAETITRSKSRDMYYILLIITDGAICDMEATIHSIVEARELPLSIIIVGVGNEDFTNMKFLDADDKPLSIHEIKGKDIVQFVEMRKFKSKAASCLAEEVTKEIPEQFMSYMEKHSIQPRKKI